MEPIRVEYDWTIDDAVAIHAVPVASSAEAARITRRARQWMGGAAAASVVVGVVLGWQAVQGGVANPQLLGPAAGCLVLAAVVGVSACRFPVPYGPGYWRDYYGRPENTWQFGPYAAAVTETGFVLVTPVSETRHRWHAVRSVTEGDGTVFVGLAGGATERVPAKAFPDPAARDRFTAAVRERIEAHRAEDAA